MRKCLGLRGTLRTGITQCRLNTNSGFFCHHHRFQPVLALLLLLSVAGSTASIFTWLFPGDEETQSNTTYKLTEQHLKPFPDEIFGILIVPFEGKNINYSGKAVKTSIINTLNARKARS